jgi:tetratricopeptide (TPR) repeat protein
MRATFLILATLAIAAPARFAFGVDAATEEARQHFLKGQQLFELTRWDEAAEEFEKAYAARSDPTFIYNMAQAYRRKGDAKRALELYKNYLIKAPRSPQRPEVEERIATLQKQIEEAERAAKAAAPVPAPAPAPSPGAVPTSGLSPAPVPGPAPAPVMAPAAAPTSLPPTFPAQGYAPSPTPGYPPTPAPAMAPGPLYAPTPTPAPAPAPAPAYVTATAATPVAESSPGKGLRTGGIVCGAAGVAFIGAGIFFGVEAQAYARTVEKGSIFNPNYDDRGKLYAKLQWVGYGVGGALLATGAVLYGLGLHAESSPMVAVLPTLMPGGAGLSAGGTY